MGIIHFEWRRDQQFFVVVNGPIINIFGTYRLYVSFITAYLYSHGIKAMIENI